MLILYQYPWKIRISCKFIHLQHPLLDVLETHPVGHIKHNDDPQSSPVATGQDRSVPLLTSSVPDLDLDLLVVNDRFSSSDVNSNGGNKIVSAGVIKKLVKKA